MTTKWKIIIGFVVMILLIGIVAAIGYFGLSGATADFTEYRRLARLNARTADLLGHQIASTADINRFRLFVDPAMAEEARTEIKAIQTVVADAETLATYQDTLDSLAGIEKGIAAQLTKIDALEKVVTETVGIYEKTMRQALLELSSDMESLGKVFLEINNIEAGAAVLTAYNHMGTLRASLARLAYNRSLGNVDNAKASLAAMAKDMESLQAHLYTEKGREAYTALRKKYDRVAVQGGSSTEIFLTDLDGLTVESFPRCPTRSCGSPLRSAKAPPHR